LGIYRVKLKALVEANWKVTGGVELKGAEAFKDAM